MQIVSNFVRIDPNRIQPHRIDRKIKLVRRNSRKLRPKGLTEKRFEMLPKRTTPPDLILPKATLRFVNGHPDSFAQRIAPVLQRQSLLVKPVSGFMDRAENRIERIVLIVARRHPCIGCIAAAKRMERAVDPTTIKIEPKQPDQFPHKKLLTLHIKPSKKVRRHLHR